MTRSLGRISIFLGVGMATIATAVGATPTCYSSPASACDDVLIKQLYVSSSGNVYVGVDTSLTSLTCTPEGAYLTLQNIAGAEKIYALLLTVHQAQQRVNIRINDGSGTCTILYAVSVK